MAANRYIYLFNTGKETNLKIGSILIENELSLIRVRKIVNSLCRLIKCTKIERVKIGTAASALAINIFEYSGQGELVFSLEEKNNKKGLQFSIKDLVRSKEEVERHLHEKTNAGSNGIGLVGAKEVMDEFHVNSLPDKGINISAILWFKDDSQIPNSIIEKLKTIFISLSDNTAIEVLKILNKDFIGLLNKLQQKNVSLAKKNLELKSQTKKMSKDIVISNDNLKREMTGRVAAETEFSKRHQALEAIFMITTTNLKKISELNEVILQQIANLSNAPLVSLSIQTSNQTFTKLIIDNKIVDNCNFRYNGPPFKSDNAITFEKNLPEVFMLDHPRFNEMNYATGIPIMLTTQVSAGNLFVFFKSEKRFEDFEEKLLKIFARYIGVETERHEMHLKLKQDVEMKTLGMITSGVAHEVRNPLNAIVTVSEALFRKIGENSKFKQHIYHIRTQVDRLTELMQDLLHLGKPLKEENLKCVPISKCISLSLVTWRETSQFAKRKINVQIDESIDHYLIRIDPDRFQQIITNLLDNACHFTPDDEQVLLHISLLSEKNKIMIKIIDHGPGLEEVYLQDFFKPFFSMRKGGTGLGTSIVKRLILLHNGKCTVYNNKPKPGLCVEICLPIAQGESGEKQK